MNLDTLSQKIGLLPSAQFASLTYVTKKSGETARYTVNLGFSYLQCLEKSVLELEISMRDFTGLKKQAAEEVMASLQESISKHKQGEQNEAYTKKGQYIHLHNGLNINKNDGTLQLFGLKHSKVTLVEGTFKPVNSKPMTILKNEIRATLPIGNFREFALDINNILTVRMNGDTLEFYNL